MVAGAEFFKDQCMLRASALTFYTLLSIIDAYEGPVGEASGTQAHTTEAQEIAEAIRALNRAAARSSANHPLVPTAAATSGGSPPPPSAPHPAT
jgi:hypothetical protein